VSFLTRIAACNQWRRDDFLPWYVAGERLGWVRRALAAELVALNLGFAVRDERLHWLAAPDDFTARGAALAAVCATLHERGQLPAPQHEPYPVTPAQREHARFVIDRAYAPAFGCRAFGQHLNGLVYINEKIHLWVARRAPTRRHYPNLYDNLVGGGLPWGMTLRENLIKECWEEAAIPRELALRARPVGAVTYCHETSSGLKPDTMYCYDLVLPATFVPRCNDGEVADFALWPLTQVAETVRDRDDFKPNCNLVVIDCLLRHGWIDPEDPDYLELVWRLRTPLP